MSDLGPPIAAAWRRRDALHDGGEVDAYRLFHGWQEGCPGLEIDRFGPCVRVEHRDHQEGLLDGVVAGLDACRRFETILARAPRGAVRALRGTVPAAPLEVREHGLRFRVDPGRAGHVGLFCDARPARRWIRSQAAGRRVLNLFAFSGSLGVAAAAGGAREVVHVDSSATALAWTRANHALNGLPVDDRSLARINVYQHLRRQQSGRQRFDAIIVDPPPLSEQAQRTDRTPGGRGIAALAPRLARMLAPQGWLLCFFHGGERGRDELEEEVIAAAGGPLHVLWRGQSGVDFPEEDERHKLRLTAFARGDGD